MLEQQQERHTNIRIRQQNLNKSSMAQWDLLNSDVHETCDILIIQEPYLDSYGNTKATHDWHVVYPNARHTLPEPPRTVTLINLKLATNQWSQLNIPDTNDNVAIRIRGDF